MQAQLTRLEQELHQLREKRERLSGRSSAAGAPDGASSSSAAEAEAAGDDALGIDTRVPNLVPEHDCSLPVALLFDDSLHDDVEERWGGGSGNGKVVAPACTPGVSLERRRLAQSTWKLRFSTPGP